MTELQLDRVQDAMEVLSFSVDSLGESLMNLDQNIATVTLVHKTLLTSLFDLDLLLFPDSPENKKS